MKLSDEAATLAFGAELLLAFRQRFELHGVVCLEGPLGAGKTTLVRGILRSLGHRGAVKSPTYTLLEPYVIDGVSIYHFDLYRVQDPLELEFVGFDEIIDGPGLKLFEWPERAANWLPSPNAVIRLTPLDQHTRDVQVEYF